MHINPDIETDEQRLPVDPVFLCCECDSLLSETLLLDSDAGDEPEDQSEGDHWRGPAPAVEEKSR